MSRPACLQCNGTVKRPGYNDATGKWESNVTCPHCGHYGPYVSRAVHIHESTRLTDYNLEFLVKLHDRLLEDRVVKTEDEAKMAAIYVLERQRMAGRIHGIDSAVDMIRRGYAWKKKVNYIGVYDGFVALGGGDDD